MSTGIRVCSLVSLLLGVLAFVPAAAGSVEVDDLLLKAQSAGKVRIIVGLDVAFTPEGDLDAVTATAQRQAIEESQNSLLSTLAGTGAKLLAQFQYIPYVALEVDAGTLVTLSSLSGVNAVTEDFAVAPTLASSNQVIGSPSAWAGFFAGLGQAVAILDTGVDKTHSFFTTGAPKVVSEACYSSTSGSSTSVCPGGVPSSTSPGSGVNCPAVVTGCNHGTHVAGIAAGYNGGPNQGVAREASIIAIQVFSRENSAAACNPNPAPCALAFTSDIISGLERVFALRTTFAIPAANLSLGSGQFFAPCDAVSPATKAAIDNLRSVRIATVIAAGNNGFRDSMSFPACISTAVSVGATDDFDNVASFSNVSSLLDLVAPGVSIDSSVPGGGVANFQGTSMAAPHVAGAWAILKQVNPPATVDDVLSVLRISGTPVNDNRPGGTVKRMPRINVNHALKYSDTVLVVDDDDDNPDMLSRYLVPLSQLGVTFRFWSTQNSDLEPDPGILNLFSKVLWFTGAEFGGVAGPGAGGEAALASYLNGRGCLLISSQDYLFDRGQTSFMTSFLGMASGNEIGQTAVTGQGSFFGPLGFQSLSYPFPNFSDRISPDATATTAFLGNLATAGVMKNTGVYRTAFLGFPLEALSSAAVRQQAINAGLQFCDTIFSDVTPGYWAKRWVEAAYLSDITGGCSTVPFNYCPESLVTREQMAVFLLKAKEGPNYVPPPCTISPFNDVPFGPFCPWIQELVNRGITSGCGGGNFCPTSSVTREQMAIFLLKTKEGAGYVPPPCTTPPFADVPLGPFCPWIQELVNRGVTGGCSPGLYCPASPSTRAQMAVFLVTNFGLPLP